ncbi:MAG: thiamine diphosphokinase, partial [Solobacterium sp.]|nr:thiamine diphosphokinase [Solobacterium sp.]
EEEMTLIRKFSDEVMALNPIKDDSDSEAAVDEAVRRGYEKICIAGAFGGRIDHEIVNLRLCFKYPERVILDERGNYCIALKEGVHIIKKKGYRYLSVFAQKRCEITLKGFKYPLDHRVLDETSLYGLSNEILEEEGIIEVHSGMILVIMSRDKA